MISDNSSTSPGEPRMHGARWPNALSYNIMVNACATIVMAQRDQLPS